MQLADLTREQRRDVCILVRLDPCVRGPQVVCDRRVDDGDVLAVDLRSLHLLQRRHGLVDLVRRQLRRQVEACTAGDCRMRAARCDLVAVLHVRACHDRVAHALVDGRTRGSAELFGRAQDDVVQRMQLQLIRDRHIQADLLDRAGRAGLAHLLAGRDDAFGQLLRVLQRVPLAPLDGLSVVARQRLTACQLRMHEVRPCVLEQLRVVERLHGRRERVVAAECGRLTGACVYIVAGRVDERTGVSKKLKSDFGFKHSFLSPFSGDHSFPSCRAAAHVLYLRS